MTQSNYQLLGHDLHTLTVKRLQTKHVCLIRDTISLDHYPGNMTPIDLIQYTVEDNHRLEPLILQTL